MPEGIVKNFNHRRGFGFILGDDGTEYFAHVSDLLGFILANDGDRVSFVVAQGPKGPQAKQVEKLD